MADVGCGHGASTMMMAKAYPKSRFYGFDYHSGSLSTLKPDGVWMIVEPFAHDKPEQNHNPIGRIYYSASTMICTPASLAQEVGAALGGQAGEHRIQIIVTAAGFRSFRRAAETPFNLVYEARP